MESERERQRERHTHTDVGVLLLQYYKSIILCCKYNDYAFYICHLFTWNIINFFSDVYIGNRTLMK